VKRRMLRLAALLALLAGGGLLGVASGIVPIGASGGHWPITAWFLQFAKQRSVSTHSLSIDAPPLDDPALVQRGAAHYHTGCRSCHGSPEEPHPVVARGMRPVPPYPGSLTHPWSAEELFTLVKHGLKFTGMPAWPAQQRDDEVWAMVAFLQRFPALDAAQYRELALGETAGLDEAAASGALDGSAAFRATLLASCARCHGADGLGRGGAFPRLAGQPSAYLRAALGAYARGERHSGVMQPVAAALAGEVIAELADHFASLPQAPAPGGDPAAVARGADIAQRGVPGAGVPSCVDCHGPTDAPRNPAYPLLAGQPADYLVLQLELFQRDQRGGSPYARLMRPIAARLTAEQMRDVAAYYASLPAEGPPSAK
jgi:cytochrome c553